MSHFANFNYMPALLQRQLPFRIVTDQAGHTEDGMQWPAVLALPLLLDLWAVGFRRLSCTQWGSQGVHGTVSMPTACTLPTPCSGQAGRIWGGHLTILLSKLTWKEIWMIWCLGSVFILMSGWFKTCLSVWLSVMVLAPTPDDFH